MSIIDDIRTAVFDGEEDLIHDMVTKALGDGQTADDIMHKALIEGLTLTGNAFEKGKKIYSGNADVLRSHENRYEYSKSDFER